MLWTDNLLTGGYLDHMIILAVTLVLFSLGVWTLDIKRTRMLVAAVTCSLALWIILIIASKLASMAMLAVLT